MRNKLELLYGKLFSSLGPQHWWPAKTAFEVMVGAILTQNTNWSNVERALKQLKQEKVLTPAQLHGLPRGRLARLIRSAGYYNIKEKRLKEFLRFFFKEYGGSIAKISGVSEERLRPQLLAVNGIGPETADSILLYALNKPVFVVDAYTRRILARHGLIQEDSDYQEVQNLFMQNLKKDVKLFNEYHALFVRCGKEFCLKRKPKCDVCPLHMKSK
jgi:endonuclease III related protein